MMNVPKFDEESDREIEEADQKQELSYEERILKIMEEEL